MARLRRHGPLVPRWHFIGGQPLMEVAMASDAGLQTALQLLVAKPRGRKR